MIQHYQEAVLLSPGRRNSNFSVGSKEKEQRWEFLRPVSPKKKKNLVKWSSVASCLWRLCKKITSPACINVILIPSLIALVKSRTSMAVSDSEVFSLLWNHRIRQIFTWILGIGVRMLLWILVTLGWKNSNVNSPINAPYNSLGLV